MNYEADQLGRLATGGEDGAEDVGEIDAGQPKSLAAGHDGGQRQRCHEAPEQPISPVHTRAFSAFGSSLLSGTWRGIGARPCSRRARDRAALMSPTWVKAWGKLPSAAPVPGSISS